MVYLSGDCLSVDDVVTKALSKLQVKRNGAMQLILCKEEMDMTPKEVLLEEFAIKSVSLQMQDKPNH